MGRPSLHLGFLGCMGVPLAAAVLAALGPAGGAPAFAQDLAAAEVGAEPVAAEPASVERELCDLIETAARDNGLPIDFFTRLLWKESNFRAGAVSPKGAQGIAQFMPGTAAERGLPDPFDPIQAIPASASYLRDLNAQFGNLGLAAAAYNAGVARVTNWIAGRSGLPFETQDYVLTITGEPAETWASPELGAAAAAKPRPDQDCVKLAGLLKVRGSPASATLTAHGPWGVQLAGHYSEAKALAAYAGLQRKFSSVLAGKAPMVIRGPLPGRGKRAFYRIRVPADSREGAEKICASLKAAGGTCIVLKT